MRDTEAGRSTGQKQKSKGGNLEESSDLHLGSEGKGWGVCVLERRWGGSVASHFYGSLPDVSA